MCDLGKARIVITPRVVSVDADFMDRQLKFLHSLRDEGCYEECYDGEDRGCLDELIELCEVVRDLYE